MTASRFVQAACPLFVCMYIVARCNARAFRVCQLHPRWRGCPTSAIADAGRASSAAVAVAVAGVASMADCLATLVSSRVTQMTRIATRCHLRQTPHSQPWSRAFPRPQLPHIQPVCAALETLWSWILSQRPGPALIEPSWPLAASSLLRWARAGQGSQTRPILGPLPGNCCA